ncbi:helix-turn-helix domain-containing protein [Allostreptomyces psammosilenae]|uniref:Transcriptional regulator with XRE-family HTH domain n=1 Tax=Allostreptomyces psammosilenae TaxID=1892865 RepID=A0A852ZWL9_9ACTN|nr:helix-turn-helix transcriptional regulator [Allostreptomyces psammosilenae]NYI05144.1 transcriptional regulator with XRE-family HTH domain [Allostreptomyces psammosilenae]
MPEVKPTVRQRRLGLELRQLRRNRGWTLEEAAKRLEYSVASLSKIENGRQRISPRVLPFIFDAYGLEIPEQRAAIVQLTREASRKNWWQAYKGVVSDPFDDYLSLESTAVGLNAYTPVVIPGLLQTEEYARAVTEASRAWENRDDIERFVQVRMARQEVLRGDHPLRLWVVLSESVLRQRVGGPAVMRAQLEHLAATVHAMPHVIVQVLPFEAGAHAGMDGPFTLLRFDAGSDVVCIESMRASLYLEQSDEVELYAQTFDHLSAAALTARQSLDLITELGKET